MLKNNLGNTIFVGNPEIKLALRQLTNWPWGLPLMLEALGRPSVRSGFLWCPLQKLAWRLTQWPAD